MVEIELVKDSEGYSAETFKSASIEIFRQFLQDNKDEYLLNDGDVKDE